MRMGRTLAGVLAVVSSVGRGGGVVEGLVAGALEAGVLGGEGGV